MELRVFRGDLILIFSRQICRRILAICPLGFRFALILNKCRQEFPSTSYMAIIILRGSFCFSMSFHSPRGSVASFGVAQWILWCLGRLFCRSFGSGVAWSLYVVSRTLNRFFCRCFGHGSEQIFELEYKRDSWPSPTQIRSD